MSTLSGPVSAPADISRRLGSSDDPAAKRSASGSSRLAEENVGPWLREYEGYRGTLVFTSEGPRQRT